MTEYMTRNVLAAIDYRINHNYILRFFQNHFDGEAKQFYQNYVQFVCNTYEEACTKIWNEYKSIVRQTKS